MVEWFKLNSELHRRNSEADDTFIFKLFCLVIDVDIAEDDIDKINFSKGKEIEYFDKLKDFVIKNNLVDHDLLSVDSKMFNTFKSNHISERIKNDIKEFENIKGKIRRLKSIFLIIRNFYKETTMELILRKIWRRLFWLSKSISI